MALCARQGGRRGLGNWLRGLFGEWVVRGRSIDCCAAKVFVRAAVAEVEEGGGWVVSLTEEMSSCSRLLLDGEHATGGMRCALACCGPKTACRVLVEDLMVVAQSC